MKTIEKYTKDIEKNLNNLRGEIENTEFNNLWNNSVAFEEETIGKKLQELLGLTRDTLESEVVHEKGTGMVLDKYKYNINTVIQIAYIRHSRRVHKFYIFSQCWGNM